jgi:hypothetical protein
MIWLFERGDRVARLVTRFDPTSTEYVLETQWSDGLLSTERFFDVAAFQRRILALERQLLSEEWTQAGDSPTLIVGDWWKP